MALKYKGKYVGADADVTDRLQRHARTLRTRRYLLRALPEGLEPQHFHTQIFDNYITGTRLRLRKERVPAKREWTWTLKQKFAPDREDLSRTLVTDIYLTQYEYEVLSVFEDNEIRKNRYPYKHKGRAYSIDVFLGDLHGLILAQTSFETDEELDDFTSLPQFAIREVTHDEMFTGAKLVTLKSDNLRDYLKKP